MAQRLPPGFRFHPTDEELVAFYLKSKINGKLIDMNPIGVVDLYKCEPWDLPDKSLRAGNDQEWYFYSARDKKYPNGSRTNRATDRGYWKSTGKDRTVRCQHSTGMKKTLVYYTGRAPRGERTDWVMHEYRMEDRVYENLRGQQEPYVLARVFKKSGSGPKNGEQYGAPFIEEPDSPLVNYEEEVLPSELLAVIKVEPLQFKIPGPERTLPAGGSDESLFSNLGCLEDYIDEECINTEFTSPMNEFDIPDSMLGTPRSGDDAITVDDIVNMVQRQPEVNVEDYSWREAVINNDLMFNGEFFDAEGELDFGSVPPAADSVGGTFAEDFLEINDLINSGAEPQNYDSTFLAGEVESYGTTIPGGELQSYDSRSSEIQLRPRRNIARPMQFDPQGDTARRMLLMRHPGSQPEDLASALPAPTIFHTSASSRDLSAFADLATFSHDLQRPEEGWSIDGELLDLAREGAGEAPDSDIWSNYEGTLPSSSEDPQRAIVQSLDGTLQSELDSSTPADFPALYWQTSDRVPPAPNVADSEQKKPSGKLSGISSLLPILPASAAELPSFSNTYVTASDTHVTALTITCSCSENGAKHVQAVVMNYAGGKVHQEMMSGTWKPCTEDCKQQACVQCNQRRQPRKQVVKGSSSGFVYVFLLGVASALIWFLLLRGTWRIAQHMYNVIL